MSPSPQTTHMHSGYIWKLLQLSNIVWCGASSSNDECLPNGCDVVVIEQWSLVWRITIRLSMLSRLMWCCCYQAVSGVAHHHEVNACPTDVSISSNHTHALSIYLMAVAIEYKIWCSASSSNVECLPNRCDVVVIEQWTPVWHIAMKWMLAQRMCPSPHTTHMHSGYLGGCHNWGTKFGEAQHRQIMNDCPTDAMFMRLSSGLRYYDEWMLIAMKSAHLWHIRQNNDVCNCVWKYTLLNLIT